MDDGVRAGLGRCAKLAPAMTLCECAETSFSEVLRRLRAGESLDAVQAATGVGLLCTACLPDLCERLAQAEQAAAPPRAASSEPIDSAA
jgi:NAD(P)H-nitrite reductase large subunit